MSRCAVLPIACALIVCGCSGGNSAQQPGSSTVPPPPPPPQAALGVLAGNPYGAGNVDGTGPAAAFARPYGVAADSSGNLYVTDSANNTIRKSTPTGVVTTLAGTAGVAGSADGVGAAAQFNGPGAIAIDNAGTLYVLDDGSAIRKITPDGAVTTLGSSLNAGSGIAVDKSGNVYFSSFALDEILKVTPEGTVTSFAPPSQQFSEPRGLAIDDAGNLYVADWGNCTILKITPAVVVTTVAGSTQVCTETDGTGTHATFNYPEELAVDATGNLYVTQNYGYKTVRKVTPEGVVTTVPGEFGSPQGIATDTAGNVYVADVDGNVVRKITAAGAVSAFLGGSAAGLVNGSGDVAQFSSPGDLAIDNAGNIYVNDDGNVALREITPAGEVTTHSQLAQEPPHGMSSYGSLAFSSTGIFYYTETHVQIESQGPLFGAMDMSLLSSAGRSLTLVSCFATDNPCDFPAELAIDSRGNVYFSGDQTINRVDPAGNVTVVAGEAGVAGSADGTGAAARFNAPTGIAIDSGGNVYVSDSGNNTIRKITPQNMVTTLAGTAAVTGSQDGIGAAAEFHYPRGIVVDGNGDLYVADTWNNDIRKISPDGTVRTIVGQPGKMGFISGALPGALSRPFGLALSGRTLYVNCNNAIVQVTNLP
jgi:streptogramin lyase